MKKPTIAQAKAICEALKARGVIVLAFTEDDVAGASYAASRSECQQLGYTLDCIIDAISDGRCTTWTDSMGDLAIHDFSE